VVKSFLALKEYENPARMCGVVPFASEGVVQTWDDIDSSKAKAPSSRLRRPDLDDIDSSSYPW
jgi:hypothetical protein